MMGQSTKTLKYLYISISVIAGVLFAFIYSLVPANTDDLCFMISSKGMERGFGLWNLMVDKFPDIWQTQSGRLGNFVALPFLYLFPRWVFGIVSGGIISFILLFVCTLTKVRKGSVVSWLLMSAIVFAFPWYDYMFLITYSANYVWASAAVLAAVWAFLKVDEMSSPGYYAGLLLMFVAGWMHEGFGAPLTCGLTLWLIVFRKKITVRKVCAWAFAGVGTGMTLLSPTFWVRGENEANMLQKFPYKEAIMQLGPALLFFIVFAIAFLILVSDRKRRQRLDNYGLLTITGGFCIASLVVFLKYFNGPRTGAPLLLMSAVGCGITFSAIGRNVRFKIVEWSLGCIVSIGVIVNLVFAIERQKDLNREYEEVLNLYEASPDGTIYYDLIYPTPDLSLFKTSVRQFHEKVPKTFWEWYYGPDKPIVILPSALKGFSQEKSSPSELSKGVMIYNGCIILPDTTDVDSYKRIHIVTSSGERRPSRFRRDYFKAADGKTYILLEPHDKVLDPTLEIKDVDLTDHSY